MKKSLVVVVGSLLLSTFAFAHGCCNCCCQCNSNHMMKQNSCGNNQMMMKKHKKMMQKVKPQNIDKNNVGITSNEEPDQTDPTLIEGNLENNDFKN